MPQARDVNGEVVQKVWERFGAGQNVAYTGTAGTIANPIGASNRATATLTSDNVKPLDGDTVTIGNKTYTFKTALTPTEGEVLIGADADASLLNLIRAINHSGTPDTDYKCAAAHTQVTAATSVTAHAFQITSILYGLVGNTYVTAESSSHLSWGGNSMSGGIQPSRRQIRVMCTTAAFVSVGPAPTATTADFPVAANTPEIISCMEGDKVSAVQVASGGTLYVVELY